MYNKDNIAKVRQDEARAKVQEEEDGRRMQELDAERRIQILRDPESSLAAPPPPLDTTEKVTTREKKQGDTRHRKRRKLAGENDTDRDIRLAKEDALHSEEKLHKPIVHKPKPENDAPIVDKSGHISLFPAESSHRKDREKNPEAEAEAAKKKREFEDQYTMRFSNAAGFKKDIGGAPWYSSSVQDVAAQSHEAPSKDVWGNEDPRRQERNKQRMNANDPLAAIKKGVRQLREVEQERNKWQEERDRDLRALKREEKESRRHRRHRRKASDDDLEDFRLDDNPDEDDRRKRRRHSRRRERQSGERSSRHSRRDSEHRTRRTPSHRDRYESSTRATQEPLGWVQAPGKRYSAQFAGI